MPNCTNTGFAAALVACLVTTCLMGGAHAYACSTDADCAYKGCADRPCTDNTNQHCNNDVWHFFCDFYYTGTGTCGNWECIGECPTWCPAPNSCAPGKYSTDGLDYIGDGACKPCDAGSYSTSPGATNCSPCPSGTTSPAGSTSLNDCVASTTTGTSTPSTTPAPTTSPVITTQTPSPPPPPSAPPSRSKDWGKAEYDHCVQALSWAELIQGDKTGTVTFKMGGLGALMEDEGYETWQCIRDHYCAADAADPWFCFVYHETDKVFTPWGHNALLQLVSPSPCDCQCSCP